MTTQHPGHVDQIGTDIQEAETALREVTVGDLVDCSQRIAYAQASATLAVARLLFNTQFN